MVKPCLFLFALAGCGGIAIIDDGAGGAGSSTAASTVSVVSSSTGSSYPCTAPTGPGLQFGELCLQDARAPCPPLAEELDQQFLGQLLDECEASLAQCCPVSAQARCGPDPNASGCCYIVLTTTPTGGCL